MSLSVQQLNLAATFPEIRWSADHRVCVFRPAGVLNATVAARMVAWLKEIENDREQPFSRFCDLTKLRHIEISISDAKKTAYWRRANYDGPLVKSAFLAHSDECQIIAHAYQFFMSGSQIMVKVFQSLPDAAAWLGVPEESLDAERPCD